MQRDLIVFANIDANLNLEVGTSIDVRLNGREKPLLSINLTQVQASKSYLSIVWLRGYVNVEDLKSSHTYDIALNVTDGCIALCPHQQQTMRHPLAYHALTGSKLIPPRKIVNQSADECWAV